MRSMDSILVIAAHPDDEVLSCGGTIARFVEEGIEVYVAILGEGITSRYNNRAIADSQDLKKLKESCKSVAEFLGIKELFLFDLPDNRFDTVSLLDIIKIIESIIDKVKPSIIFTHHSGDLNIDHSIVHRATITATRPILGKTVKTVYTYEIPSSTDWAFGQFGTTFKPNVFIDIEKTLEKKVNAMLIYESEVRAFPHPRSPDALKAVSYRWGSIAGVKAAEAFELIREIK